MSEEDPWKGYDPNAPLPEPVKVDEIEKAIKDMAQPQRPPYISYLALPLVFFWGLGHFYVLYIMVGTPLATSVFLIVLVNLLFLIHYFIFLILKVGGRRK